MEKSRMTERKHVFRRERLFISRQIYGAQFSKDVDKSPVEYRFSYRNLRPSLIYLMENNKRKAKNKKENPKPQKP